MPLHLLDHPLAAHCLAVLRDRRTGPDAFRRYCERLTLLLAVEATRGDFGDRLYGTLAP